MSTLKNSRINSYIEQNFASLIDVSQVITDDRATNLLTRGVAALAVISFTGCGFDDAAEAIVDGCGDNGIDAISYDGYTNTVYFVQSKWSKYGNKTIDEAAAHKMIHGVQKLLELDFEGFNVNVKKKRHILDKITSDASVKIVLCLAYNSTSDISDSVRGIFSEYIERINDGDDIMTLRVANQCSLYDVASKSRGPVNEDIVIRDWTKIASSRDDAYFGFVAASDLAILYEKHQDSLFTPNIRSFKGDTDVNNMIVDSIMNTPDIFCYLNNGITLIANEIKKKPLGGSSRESGVFECSALAVVNGAQTVGACHRAYKKSKDKTDVAYVVAKFIETKQHDSELSRSITKAANTQNKIERKDFVALDPYQKDLQEGLDILGVKYVYKTGDEKHGENCYDLTYVVQALIANTNDINLIAVAKREIGRVWDDIERPPYKFIFNPSISAYCVRNILELFDKTQYKIKEYAGDDKRKQQYAVYGNIFIAAQCLKRIGKLKISSEEYKREENIAKIEEITPALFESVYIVAEKKYPGTPLVYLFRNANKLKEIDGALP